MLYAKRISNQQMLRMDFAPTFVKYVVDDLYEYAAYAGLVDIVASHRFGKEHLKESRHIS